MNKIRVGIVNYLNTRPLLYGLERSSALPEMELRSDYPSRLAQLLIRDEIDLGLVPVATLAERPDFIRVGYHCIASEGPVASVCLFSNVPLSAIKTVWLDYQSRTSVMLLRILFREYWKLPVRFAETAVADYLTQIQGDCAGLVIGDRALEQRSRFPYVYDLAEAWKQFQQVPFVFAAWVARRPLPDSFMVRFNAANEWGLDRIERVLEAYPAFPHYDLATYFSRNIAYRWDEKKETGLQAFLRLIGANN